MKNIRNDFSNIINNHIILNAFNLNDLGLYRGKMGLVLYFYIYSDFRKEKIYQEFAFELLENILIEINTHIPFFFDDGLCGIGWGIEYLFQNNYISGDTNNILCDLDSYIMQIDPARIIDESMDKGLLGLINYILVRLTSIARNTDTPFDPKYLKNLYELIVEKRHRYSLELHSIFNHFINYYRQPYLKKICFNYSVLDHSLEIMQIKEEDIRNHPLGLKSGLAGTCLKQILLNE